MSQERNDQSAFYYAGDAGNKKALPTVRRACKYVVDILSKRGSDLSVLAWGEMELAPCLAIHETGCQGFIGPFPSAFLDKRYKELR
jgi:hypothetical protein